MRRLEATWSSGWPVTSSAGRPAAAWLFTIHDCLATTEEQKDHFTEVHTDAFHQSYGVPPGLRRDAVRRRLNAAEFDPQHTTSR
jgi:hypothetical protein